MASIEFTKTFTITATASGLTGNNFLYLGSALGSKFVVKYMSIFSTGGLSITTNPTFYMRNSDDTAGTNLTNVLLYTATAAVAPNGGIVVFNANQPLPTGLPFGQVILSRPYLVLNINATAAGNIYVTISFLVINTANVNTGNFLSTSGTVSTGTTSIFTPTTTNASSIKSLIISNFNDTTNSYSTTPVILNASSSAVSFLANSLSATPGNSVTYASKIYLSTTSPGTGYSLGLIVSSVGTNTLNYYVSYTTDPDA